MLTGAQSVPGCGVQIGEALGTTGREGCGGAPWRLEFADGLGQGQGGRGQRPVDSGAAQAPDGVDTAVCGQADHLRRVAFRAWTGRAEKQNEPDSLNLGKPRIRSRSCGESPCDSAMCVGLGVWTWARTVWKHSATG